MTKKKNETSYSIPIGGIISFIMFIYLLMDNLWYKIGFMTKFLVILAFIILTLCGWIEHTSKSEEQTNV